MGERRWYGGFGLLNLLDCTKDQLDALKKGTQEGAAGRRSAGARAVFLPALLFLPLLPESLFVLLFLYGFQIFSLLT